MKYLLFAVYQDFHNVSTHSCIYETNDVSFEDKLYCNFRDDDKIEYENYCQLTNELVVCVSKNSLSKRVLYELFVFKSAENNNGAPEQIAYFTVDDGFFGEYQDEEKEAIEENTNEISEREEEDSDVF